MLDFVLSYLLCNTEKEEEKVNSFNSLHVHDVAKKISEGDILKIFLFLAEDSFVCVEVLRSSQPNGVMSSMVILPYHTFTGQA